MRLIDADTVLKRLQEWNTRDSIDKALFNFAENRICEAPTVDAIPISAIEDIKTEIRQLTINYDKSLDYKDTLTG